MSRFETYRGRDESARWKYEAEASERQSNLGMLSAVLNAGTSIYETRSNAGVKEAQKNAYTAQTALYKQKTEADAAENEFTGGLMKDLGEISALNKTDPEAAAKLRARLESDPNFKLKMAALQKRLSLTTADSQTLIADSRVSNIGYGDVEGQPDAFKPVLSERIRTWDAWSSSFDSFVSSPKKEARSSRWP